MNTAANIPESTPSLAVQITRLPELPMTQIKALWRRVVGGDTPTANRAFLERRIAYRLQEIEFRKQDANLLERNKRRIASLVETGKLKQRDRDYRPVPGTVLTRHYQGIDHRVVVTAEGQYEFQGRSYPSLSMIAREITGTRWSGPLFFGLKAPTKPKASNRGGA